mgnify:CR=1 FL=1
MRNIETFLIIEKAQSKSQRRLFGMALAYKRGELEDSEVSDEIMDLSELPEKTLRTYAKTKETNLPNKIDERKTIQVKRKYSNYDSISVGANAPVRNSILGFISENGYCTKEQLTDFINSNNEESGKRTSLSWLKKNKHYITEFNKNGCICCKLSKLGKRVVNKTNISE